MFSIDESPPTLKERFERAGIELADDGDATQYRELVVTAPDLGTYASGCVLTADALFEETEGGTPFVDLLAAQNIVPGVRVDCGDVPLPGAVEGETCSRGLDGLEERAALYREQGARFAKWRGRIRIDDSRGAPSFLALKETCWTMARTARTLQEKGLVPLLEPAVLADGDHTIERAAEVQERVYVDVFRALAENGVFLEGCLLKPMMSTPGTSCPEAATPELVAAYSRADAGTDRAVGRAGRLLQLRHARRGGGVAVSGRDESHRAEGALERDLRVLVVAPDVGRADVGRLERTTSARPRRRSSRGAARTARRIWANMHPGRRAAGWTSRSLAEGRSSAA